jgi:hypothetical protein
MIDALEHAFCTGTVLRFRHLPPPQIESIFPRTAFWFMHSPLRKVVPGGHSTQEKEVFLVDELGAEVGVHSIGEIVVKSHYLTTGY